jgi:hypothetical protein
VIERSDISMTSNKNDANEGTVPGSETTFWLHMLPAGDDGELVGTLRRLYLNEVDGRAPRPRRC